MARSRRARRLAAADAQAAARARRTLGTEKEQRPTTELSYDQALDLPGASWWTIEVTDHDQDAAEQVPALPGNTARRWKDARGAGLIEAALTHGAKDWGWTVTDWGVVFEVAFADEADWLRFRATPAVQAALDAVPDPINGLFVYPGRGGGSGARVPRRPRTTPLSDAAYPVPDPEPDGGPPLGQFSNRPRPTGAREVGTPAPGRPT